MHIGFNKPYLTGNERDYIYKAVLSGKISGDGIYTKQCHQLFQQKFGFKKCLLTTSCTDALEMTALLIDVKPGDEIIVPSYTFVSTALAFVRQGATLKFVDSRADHPGMDEEKIEELITEKTRAIVVVHYAGVACDMDKVMALSKKYNLFIIEDAAQAIDSFYNGKPLGGIGHFGCFSFHETKNIQCGEGGMLVINDEKFIERAEIIWEKGTNRSKFFRGEIAKYSWIDIGSSFLPSDILAAFLLAQSENIDAIQEKRKWIWNQYYNALKPLADKGFFQMSFTPQYATNNAHMFYITCNSLEQRTGLINFLKAEDINSVFHYISLHRSDFMKDKMQSVELPYADLYTDRLLRLPMFFELTSEQIKRVCDNIENFMLQ